MVPPRDGKEGSAHHKSHGRQLSLHERIYFWGQSPCSLYLPVLLVVSSLVNMAATNITSPALCPGMPDGTIPLVPVFDWDPHMYFLCFLVTAGIQLSCFAVAYGCQFDTITDFAGSMNFVLLAILCTCCTIFHFFCKK